MPDVPGKFPVPRNYVMSPFLWEPSESVSCPVFGLTLRIVASRFSSLGCVFFFGGVMSVYVHGDFTHAVNEVFVLFVFVLVCSGSAKGFAAAYRAEFNEDILPITILDR